MPRAKLVGTLDCLRSGELVDEASTAGSLQDGFPPACFVPSGLESPPFDEASSYNSCGIQKFYAGIIDFMYADDTARIVSAFRAFLGVSVSIVFHPVEALFPAVVTVITPDYAIVVVDGTRSFQQLATQAFYSLRKPTSFGILETNPFWYDASTKIHSYLVADGMQPDVPVMIVGHSYGAAAALGVAARYRHWRPERVIRYLTFGSPKPGGIKLFNLLSRCHGVNLANDDDPVTLLCPDYLTLLPVMLALGAPQIEVWADWIRPPNQVRMDDDGSLHPNELPFLDYSTLLAMAAKALANLELDPIAGHRITEYFRRITGRCDAPEWPIDTEVNDLLKYNLSDVIIGRELPADTGLILGELRIYTPETELIFGEVPTYEEIPEADLVVGHGAESIPDVGLELGASNEHEAIGSIELGGVFQMNPTGDLIVGHEENLPGPTCEDAMDLEIGQTWSYVTSVLHEQWYRMPIPAFTIMHLRLNSAGPDWYDSTVYDGFDCDNIFLRVTWFFAPQCYATVFAVDNYMWFRVLPTVAPTAYEITWDVGPCP